MYQASSPSAGSFAPAAFSTSAPISQQTFPPQNPAAPASFATYVPSQPTAAPTLGVPVAASQEPLHQEVLGDLQQVAQSVTGFFQGRRNPPPNVPTPVAAVAYAGPQAPLATPAPTTTAQTVSALTTGETTVDAGAENGFAGAGWLMPLVPRSRMDRDARAGVPPFALTDDEGNVLQLVTPSPGLNLRQYVRQRVGVQGHAAPLANLATPHLVAQRVVVLDRHAP
jgi:hypothetical protein